MRRPAKERGLDAPTMWHGVSGLLVITLRFAHEAGNEALRDHIPHLVRQLLSSFQPASAFGFRDLEQGRQVDRPGWLCGASGVALTLLASSTDLAPTWDHSLLLS